MKIEEMLERSKDLYELNKDKWSPMTPEHGKTFILYMIEEIGEVISIIKKKGEDEIMNNPEVRERFVEEMADVMMYYSDTLNRFGVTEEEFTNAYRRKHDHNMKRNYTKDHAES
jgi:NTP pyrophosphatase (non-canonical NTP hydrolase)